MNVGKTLLKGVTYIGAVIGGIWAVDRAAGHVTESLKEVQDRRKEYASGVQRHYTTCFAKGQSMLVEARFDNVSIRTAAFLPIPSPDVVCFTPTHTHIHIHTTR